jgi:hypothetical protein
VQKLILISSYIFYKIFNIFSKSNDYWTIGPFETAGIVKLLSCAIPNSYSVVMQKVEYYDYNYDYNYRFKRNTTFKRIYCGLISPIILARYTFKCSGFIYVGDRGFLLSSIDSRRFEYNFLKKKNKAIVSYFVGNDIRSHTIMYQKYLVSGEENYSNYLPWIDEKFKSLIYDKSKYNTAQVSLKYSGAIFSTQYDQGSYLDGKHYPVTYLYDFENRTFNHKKFKNLRLKRVNIFHAPSSPIIKGTQVIRAIIKMLELDGFDFNYIEKIGVSNKEVLQQLAESHIVINELYAFMPGIFTIEAIANSCAVLTRADPNFEKSLPLGSENAWIITPSYSLYRNLRSLLEDPESIEKQALNGFNWAVEHASLQSEGPKLQKILNGVLRSSQ